MKIRVVATDCNGLVVEVPWHVRILHSWHENICLQPSNEQLLARSMIVAIAANHIRENVRITDQIGVQQCWNERSQSIITRPFCIFVQHSNKYGQMLCILGGSNFDESAKSTDQIYICGRQCTRMPWNGAVQNGILFTRTNQLPKKYSKIC